MKKKRPMLSLDAETIRTLTERDLIRIGGGFTSDLCDTNAPLTGCWSCPARICQ